MTIAIGGGTVAGQRAPSPSFVAGAATEPDVEIHGDDIWEIIFTSGTTAMPKGAMVSHRYSYLGAYSFALTLTRGIPFECDLRLVAFLPLIYHIADQIFSSPALLSGGTLVIGPQTRPARGRRRAGRGAATALWGGSPAMLEELANELERRPSWTSGLQAPIFGWTATPPELVDRLKALASPS